MPYIALFLLAVIDIFSGTLLYFHPSFLVKPFLYFGIICLIKGGWSVLASIASRFYFDLLGFLDLLVGLFLILLYYGTSFPFFSVFGIVILLKGIWTLFFSIASN